MHIRLTFAAAALLMAGAAHAFETDLSKLKPVDQALYVGMQTATVADWLQTRDIARECRSPQPRYQEGNPLLGSCPSTGRVNTAMSARLMLQHFAATNVPEQYRTAYLVGANAIQWYVVARNHKLGVQLDAPDYALHAGVSFSLGAATRALWPGLSQAEATGIASIPGLIKELTDKKFSSSDMAANILGAYLGQLTGRWAFSPKDGGAQLSYSKEF